MNLDDIQKNPMLFLQKAKKKDIIDLLIKADNAFFNTGNTLLSDDIYDIIKDYIREKYPKDAYLKRVGADEENKVKLPFYMGSQNKIRDDENEIKKFKDKYKGPYVISDKLDGISCLIVYGNGDIKIYTRGNGTEGQNISHIIDYVKGIPKKLKTNEKNVAIRGELIISKTNWEELKKKGEQGANARNVVAGTINSKILNKTILNQIEFVAYDLLKPSMKLYDSFKYLKDIGITVVRHELLDNINLDILSDYLQRWRKDSEYVIDGIVISDNDIHPIVKGKNPNYSFAFKSIHTHDQVEVIVTEVEWNVSKDKYLKPIVKFNEVDLDGVKIKQATGFNAGFIEKNKIGAGSRIIIIRSGNVIPHILSVISPSANGKASLPQIEYIWNDTKVDIIATDEKNRDFEVKNILYFMKTLNVEHMGPGNIAKIYDAGFDSIKKMVNIKLEDLLKIEGYKEKGANNLLSSLAKIKEVDCLTLMDASNMLGRGFSSKKIKTITDVYPVILKQDKKSREKALSLKTEDLVKIPGIAEISAKLFLESLPNFHKFYDDLEVKCSYVKEESVNNHSKSINLNIKDQTFIFSGFRNKDLETYINNNGGQVKNSISKNSNYLIVKDKSDTNAKITKAIELGINIIQVDDIQFKKIFASFNE